MLSITGGRCYGFIFQRNRQQPVCCQKIAEISCDTKDVSNVLQVKRPLEKQPPMLTIGNECAGYVEAVGEGVTDFQPGMPVWVVHMQPRG